MDNFLIDFNSPKLRRGDTPLKPQCLMGSPLIPNSTVPYSVTGEESNPFDLLVCQAAAHSAAEFDPFEMVLNDVIKRQDQESKEEVIEVNNETLVADSPKPLDKYARRSMSLPDLRQCVEMESPSHTDEQNLRSSRGVNQFSPEKCSIKDDYVHSNDSVSRDSVEWSCLDDIPPPDSLLNTTMDMTCFLDDTLSTNSPRLTSMKHSLTTDVLKQQFSSMSSGIEKLSINKDQKLTYKSEDELKLLAQKKIENIISKAELEVRCDIQNSIVQKRLSIETMSKPSLEVLALCTPRKPRDSYSRPIEESSWSFKKWSESELRKLDLILPDSTPKVKDSFAVHFPDFPKEEMNFFTNNANISSEEMPVEDLAILSPLHQVTPPKGKNVKNASSDCEQTKPSPVVMTSPSSPVLRPLPLCEDAVRNMSLCSKYSPQKHLQDVQDRAAAATSNQEKHSKQAKLTVRKPVVPCKTQSKMAPMKATAPIQNMTRTKLSLSAAPKSDARHSSSLVTGKSALKEMCTKPAVSENTRVYSRLPQSPSRALSGSLPNLSTPGSKLPSRLPSPRRASGALHEPMNLKQRLDSVKDRSIPQVSSPRPVRRSSPCKGASQPRVLAEINTCSGARKSPKRRISQVAAPKRISRSISSGKENLV